MEFVKLQPKHREEVVALIAEMFMKQEPRTSCLKVPLDTMVYYCEDAFDQALDSDVSVVAVDTEEDKVVGVLINFLEGGTHGEPRSNFADHALLQPLAPIASLESQIKERLNGLKDVKKLRENGDVIMELYLGAVKEGYQGRSIGRRLLEESLMMGISKGAKIVHVEATGPLSQHVLLTIPGFVQVGEMIEYSTFEYDGKRPFSNMPAKFRGTMLFMKKLTTGQF